MGKRPRPHESAVLKEQTRGVDREPRINASSVGRGGLLEIVQGSALRFKKNLLESGERRDIRTHPTETKKAATKQLRTGERGFLSIHVLGENRVRPTG